MNIIMKSANLKWKISFFLLLKLSFAYGQESGIQPLGVELPIHESFKDDDSDEHKTSKSYDKLVSSEGYISGSQEDNNTFADGQLSKNLKLLEKNTRDHFSFNFYKDDYNYKNKSDNFDKIFRSKSDSSLPIFIRFKYQFLYFSKLGHLGGGMAFGASFFKGKGIFIDGQTSTTQFKFYSLPLDIFGAYHLPLWKDNIMVDLSVGPTITTLIQNRSDYLPSKRGKNFYQVGFGISSEVLLKFNLTKLFIPHNDYSLMEKNHISRYYLGLNARFTSINQFKTREYRINGTSFGVSFTYELF